MSLAIHEFASLEIMHTQQGRHPPPPPLSQWHR